MTTSTVVLAVRPFQKAFGHWHEDLVPSGYALHPGQRPDGSGRTPS